MKAFTLIIVLMMLLFSSFYLLADDGIIIYSEDFSSDPGWITNNSSNFYWDATGGRYHYKIIDATNEYAYHLLDLQNRSFELKYDLLPTYTGFAGNARCGVSNVNLSGYEPTCILADFNVTSGGGHEIDLCLYDNAGTYNCATFGHVYSDNVTYQVIINYDNTTQTVSFEVIQKESGNIVCQTTKVGFGPFMGMDRIFMSSIGDVGYPGCYAEGYIDNVVVRVNPSEPSPNLIAYATRESGTWELWRLDPNTLAKSRIVSVGGTVIWGVAWSPDRSKIAFANNRTGATEIYVVNADGSDLTQVTTDGASWPDCGNYKPCWVDDEYILYSSRRVNVGQREIIRIKIDGTEQEVLTNLGGTHDSYAMPWFSPDRTMITYIKGVPYAAATCKIYVGDYPTFDHQIIVGDINGNSYAEWEPIWSTNDLIAFDTDAGGDIYTVHPDGSLLTNVSLVPGVDDRKPHFSPDGSQIAFLSNESGVYNVWVMNSDGTDRRQLTYTTESNVIGWFDWSNTEGQQVFTIICNAFLTAKKINVGAGNAAKPVPTDNPKEKHDFKIHIFPCESMDVSVGDSAEVFVDADKSGTFDNDENYLAIVSCTDLDGQATDIAINVYMGEDLINNDPCVAIYSINNIAIVDIFGNPIDYLCLDTFDPHEDNKPADFETSNFISLSQNYPNPFNPVTEISFTLTISSDVKLEIFNVKGQKVTTVIDGFLQTGEHKYEWDGSQVASGVYFYRLQARHFVQTKKMLLIK